MVTATAYLISSSWSQALGHVCDARSGLVGCAGGLLLQPESMGHPHSGITQGLEQAWYCLQTHS